LVSVGLISTSEAFDLLRTTARSTQQELAEVARSVIADLEAPNG
jgi:AmiR/NasT family two-component response regulator